MAPVPHQSEDHPPPMFIFRDASREGPMKKALLVAFAFLCAAGAARAQSLSADDLARRTIERRAVEAVIWGMPAVNTT